MEDVATIFCTPSGDLLVRKTHVASVVCRVRKLTSALGIPTAEDRREVMVYTSLTAPPQVETRIKVRVVLSMG